MARPRIRLNFRELGEALSSNEVTEALMNHVEPMMSEFQRLAPVDSGAYRNSAEIEDDIWRKGQLSLARVRLVVHDPKATLIESRKGVLRRSMRGLSRSNARDRRRDRAQDRRTAAQEAREES